MSRLAPSHSQQTPAAMNGSYEALRRSQVFLEKTMPTSGSEDPLYTIAELGKTAAVQLDAKVAAIRAKYEEDALRRKYRVKEAFADGSENGVSTALVHPLLVTPRYNAAQAVLAMFGGGSSSSSSLQSQSQEPQSIQGDHTSLSPHERSSASNGDLSEDIQDDNGRDYGSVMEEDEEQSDDAFEVYGEDGKAVEVYIGPRREVVAIVAMDQDIVDLFDDHGDQSLVVEDELGEDMDDEDDVMAHTAHTQPHLYHQQPAAYRDNTSLDVDDIFAEEERLGEEVETDEPGGDMHLDPAGFAPFSQIEGPLDGPSGSSWLTEFMGPLPGERMEEDYLRGEAMLYNQHNTYPAINGFPQPVDPNTSPDTALNSFISPTFTAGFEAFVNLSPDIEAQRNIPSSNPMPSNPLDVLAAAASWNLPSQSSQTLPNSTSQTFVTTNLIDNEVLYTQASETPLNRGLDTYLPFTPTMSQEPSSTIASMELPMLSTSYTEIEARNLPTADVSEDTLLNIPTSPSHGERGHKHDLTSFETSQLHTHLDADEDLLSVGLHRADVTGPIEKSRFPPAAGDSNEDFVISEAIRRSTSSGSSISAIEEAALSSAITDQVTEAEPATAAIPIILASATMSPRSANQSHGEADRTEPIVFESSIDFHDVLAPTPQSPSIINNDFQIIITTPSLRDLIYSQDAMDVIGSSEDVILSRTDGEEAQEIEEPVLAPDEPDVDEMADHGDTEQEDVEEVEELLLKVERDDAVLVLPHEMPNQTTVLLSSQFVQEADAMTDDEEDRDDASSVSRLMSQPTTRESTPIPAELARLRESRASTPLSAVSDLFSGDYDLDEAHPELDQKDEIPRDHLGGLALPRGQGLHLLAPPRGSQSATLEEKLEESEVKEASGETAPAHVGLEGPSQQLPVAEEQMGKVVDAPATELAVPPSVPSLASEAELGNQPNGAGVSFNTDVVPSVIVEDRIPLGDIEQQSEEGPIVDLEDTRKGALYEQDSYGHPSDLPTDSQSALVAANIPESVLLTSTEMEPDAPVDDADDLSVPHDAIGRTLDDDDKLQETHEVVDVDEEDKTTPILRDEESDIPATVPVLNSQLASPISALPTVGPEADNTPDAFEIVPHYHGSSPADNNDELPSAQKLRPQSVAHIPLTRSQCHWEKLRVILPDQPPRNFLVTICSINDTFAMEGIVREGLPRQGEFSKSFAEIPAPIANGMPDILQKLQEYLGVSALGAARWLPSSPEEVEALHAEAIPDHKHLKRPRQDEEEEDVEDLSSPLPKKLRVTPPPSQSHKRTKSATESRRRQSVKNDPAAQSQTEPYGRTRSAESRVTPTPQLSDGDHASPSSPASSSTLSPTANKSNYRLRNLPKEQDEEWLRRNASVTEDLPPRTASKRKQQDEEDDAVVETENPDSSSATQSSRRSKRRKT